MWAGGAQHTLVIRRQTSAGGMPSHLLSRCRTSAQPEGFKMLAQAQPALLQWGHGALCFLPGGVTRLFGNVQDYVHGSPTLSAQPLRGANAYQQLG